MNVNQIFRPPESHMITEFYEGATNNLPDEDACINAERIENMARRLRDPNDIFLVLLSGGDFFPQLFSRFTII